MISVLGKRFGSGYEKNARAAAEAIMLAEPNKVYVHCYLGVHRVESVRLELQALGEATGTYSVRHAERTDDARARSKRR